MRVHLGSALAVAAIAVGLASGIAGPIYSASGHSGDSATQSDSSTSVVVLKTPGRIPG